MKQAIFIDVKNKKVNSLEISPTNVLKQAYELIGCDLIECATYIGNDSLMVDEEGRLKDGLQMFYLDGYGCICGSAIVMGHDAQGEIDNCESEVNDISSRVYFMTDSECEFVRNM